MQVLSLRTTDSFRENRGTDRPVPNGDSSRGGHLKNRENYEVQNEYQRKLIFSNTLGSLQGLFF